MPNTLYTLYIMRGLPGSGKSTLAKSIAANETTIDSDKINFGVILSTDDFFLDHENNYNFNPSLLGEAHEWNQKRAFSILEAKKHQKVIIDNTHVKAWEARPYVEMGLECGYEIQIMEPVTPWWIERNALELARRNTHGVPLTVIKRMLSAWESNITVEMILSSTRR